MLQMCEDMKERVVENMVTELNAHYCKLICTFDRHTKEQFRKTNVEQLQRQVHCVIYWCCVTGTVENWREIHYKLYLL
jgi:hypothetical protein